MALSDRIADLRSRWERLTDRERAMVGALGVAFALLVVLAVGYSISSGLADLEEANADMRQALKDIDANRASYQQAKRKTSQLEARMGQGGVQLLGLLEAAAKDAGVHIDDNEEKPPAPISKQYVERAVDLHLRKVNLEELAKFLRKIETGANLVVVKELNVRSRDDKHEDLEVQMIVSTFEKAPEAKPGKKDKGDKGKPEKPEKEGEG